MEMMQPLPSFYFLGLTPPILGVFLTEKIKRRLGLHRPLLRVNASPWGGAAPSFSLAPPSFSLVNKGKGRRDKGK
jgi:hypothetical protein